MSIDCEQEEHIPSQYVGCISKCCGAEITTHYCVNNIDVFAYCKKCRQNCSVVDTGAATYPDYDLESYKAQMIKVALDMIEEAL